MGTEPYTAAKTYQTNCFILDERKFIRIVEVTKERLRRVQTNYEFSERYEVGFLDKKEIRIARSEDVINLDNSHKNPIVYLRAAFELKADAKVVYGIQIGFQSDSFYREPVYTSGISPELPWLQETIGAIEEQLERTMPKNLIYALNAGSLRFFIVLLLAIVIIPLSILTNQTKNRLPQEKIKELIVAAEQVKSDTDKIDFLFRHTVASIEKTSPSEKIKNTLSDTRTYYKGIPILITLISFLVAVFWLYPRNIFSWGDRGESYERIIERRKFVWYGVFLSLIIGVLGNLFVLGVTA